MTKKPRKSPASHGIVEQLRPLAVAVGDLVLDPANARRHPERNAEAIRASLRRFGQRKPVVVRRQGMVVEAGNGTLQAARALGWTHVAAVIVDDDPTTATGFAVADNRTAELAEWDEEALGRLLGVLRDADVPTEDVGFSDAELIDLLGPGVPTADPGAEEPGEGEADSEVGRVYELGPHRLLVGDSTSAENVSRALDGREPRLWFVDPPYDLAYGSWSLLPSVDVAAVWHRSKDALAWMGSTFSGKEWGVHGLVFTGGVRGQHNPALPCCMHDMVSVWRRKWWTDVDQAIDGNVIAASGCKATKDRRPVSWQKNVGGVLTTKGMSWGKPVLESEILMAYVPRGAVVWDPCAGSGSSLIAAAKHGRTWVGVELQPQWADMIRRRWTKWARAAGVDPGPGALSGTGAAQKPAKELARAGRAGAGATAPRRGSRPRRPASRPS